jgi:transposase-like protein
MERRGRPGRGVEHVERVDSSEPTKQRLRLILQTLSGELSVSAASEMLGVSEPHFHRLRERALTGAAEALEPRPAGRPAILRTASDERVAELEEKLEQMKLELHASQVREQIAVLMPHLLLPAGESKKNSKRRR